MKKLIELFKLPSVEIMAQRELEMARKKLLEAQSGRDFADSMVKYHEARIKRLSALIGEK